ncbi:MAG: hypothetical protein KDF65_11460, partial [Anaerolineae bacterium]|nr:hypothetical protein [Anaerolineae bacterium]
PCLSTALAVIFLLTTAHTLPAAPLRQAVTSLNAAVRPSDAIITNDPEATMPFAELYQGQAPVLGLNNGGFPLPAAVTGRLAETLAQHRQIWWLPNWLPPEQSAIEQTLLAEGFKAREENFDGQRLLLFALPGALPTRPVEATFDGRLHLLSVAKPPQVSAGSALPVELTWQALAPIGQDYHVFVHLVSEAGEVVAQADGQPANWQRPTSTWAVEELITDRHGLWLSPDTIPGRYELRLGLYDPASGARLLLPAGEDAVRVEVGVE